MEKTRLYDLQGLAGDAYEEDALEIMDAALQNEEMTREEMFMVFHGRELDKDQVAEIIKGRQNHTLSVDQMQDLALRGDKGVPGTSLDAQHIAALREAYANNLTTEQMIMEGFCNNSKDTNELLDKIQELKVHNPEHISTDNIDEEIEALGDVLDDEIADLENEKKLDDLEKDTLQEEDINAYDKAVTDILKEEKEAARKEFDEISQKYYKIVLNAHGQFEYAEAAVAETLQQQYFEKDYIDRNLLYAEDGMMDIINITPEEFAENCPFASMGFYNSLEYEMNAEYSMPHTEKLKEAGFTFLVPEDYAKQHDAGNVFIEKLKEINDITGTLPGAKTYGEIQLRDLLDRNTKAKEDFTAIKNISKKILNNIGTIATKVKNGLINVTPAAFALKIRKDTIDYLASTGALAQEAADAFKAEYQAAKEHHVFKYRDASKRKDNLLKAFGKEFEKTRDAITRNVKDIRPSIQTYRPKWSKDKYLSKVDKVFEKSWNKQEKVLANNGLKPAEIEAEKVRAKESLYKSPEVAENIKQYKLVDVANRKTTLKLSLDKLRVEVSNKRDEIKTIVNDKEYELDIQKEAEKKKFEKEIQNIAKQEAKDVREEKKAFEKEYKKLEKELKRVENPGYQSKAEEILKTKMERLQRDHDGKVASIRFEATRKKDTYRDAISNLDNKYNKKLEDFKTEKYAPLNDIANQIEAKEMLYEQFDSYYDGIKDVKAEDFAQDALDQVSYFDYMAYTDPIFEKYMDVNGQQVPREGIEIPAESIEGHEDAINNMLNKYFGSDDIKPFIVPDTNDKASIKIAALDPQAAINLKDVLSKDGVEFISKPNSIMEKMQTEIVREAKILSDEARF